MEKKSTTLRALSTLQISSKDIVQPIGCRRTDSTISLVEDWPCQTPAEKCKFTKRSFRTINTSWRVRSKRKHKHNCSADCYIMSLAWGSGSYGEMLAVGTFHKRVSIWLLRGASWIETAYYEGHDAPIRKVVWGDSAVGCSMFACSNDGCFSVNEVVGNQWKSTLMKAHEGAVNCIAVRKTPFLGEVSFRINQDKRFSRRLSNLRQRQPSLHLVARQ